MQSLQNTDNKFWLEKAREIAKSSTCIRPDTRWGAVAVKDGILLATGYNGEPHGCKTCASRGYCIRQKLGIKSGTMREVAYCICAEQRLICNAAKNGINLDGADIYVNGISCTVCVRLMIECGIKRIFQIRAGAYESALTAEIARESGLEIIYLE